MFFATPDNLPQGWRVQKVQDCTFCLAPETPDIKVTYSRRYKGVLKERALHNPDWRYLSWKFPENKELRNSIPSYVNSKIVKDESTGKPRFIVFTWRGAFDQRKKTWPYRKSNRFEIPHWDSERGILSH